MVSDAVMKRQDLTKEEWREYEFGEVEDPRPIRIYRIRHPQTLYYRKGGSTHRVLDADGVVHCVPAVGFAGCVLRWKPKGGANPVQF